MKSRVLLGYAFVVLIVVLFWRSSFKADAALQATFSKPDPMIAHASVASAKEEIQYLRTTQSDLLELHHQGFVRHSQAAIFTLIASTLMLVMALRLPRAQVNHVSSP